jgi:putative membrane protein
MIAQTVGGFEYWWIFPLVMIALCVFMMWRGMGMGCMMRGMQSQGEKERWGNVPSESALDILNKRYALGEIGKEEYEEKKKAIKDQK